MDTKKRGAVTLGLVVEHINKSFAEFLVIKDLSMEVKEEQSLASWGQTAQEKQPPCV